MNTGKELRWREPWLFSLRMRDRRGWHRKLWLIAAIFAVMLGGWYLDQRYGKGPRMGFTAGILVSAGIALFVGFLSDLGLSEIQATDDGSHGHFMAMASEPRCGGTRTFSVFPSFHPSVPASLSDFCF